MGRVQKVQKLDLLLPDIQQILEFILYSPKPRNILGELVFKLNNALQLFGPHHVKIKQIWSVRSQCTLQKSASKTAKKRKFTKLQKRISL